MAVRSGVQVTFSPITPRKLSLISTAAMVKDLTTYTKEFAEDIVKDLKKYPDPPSGSFGSQKRSRYGTRYTKRGEGQFGGEYVRTHDLQRAWKISPSISGARIAYTISNYVRDRRRGRYYAVLVHGRGDGSGQWWFHAQTGWLRIDEAVHNRGGRGGFKEGAQFIVEDHIG